MKDFNDYLSEKIEDGSSLVNESVEINKEKTIQNIIEYNWYIDKKLSLLETLGGNNESV